MDVHLFATSGSVKIEYPKFLRMADAERAKLALIINTMNPVYSAPLSTGLYMPGAKTKKMTLGQPAVLTTWLEALSQLIHGQSRVDILGQRDRWADRAFFPLLDWASHNGYGPITTARLAQDFKNFRSQITTPVQGTEPVCGLPITWELFDSVYIELQTAFETADTGRSGFVLLYTGEEGLPA